MEEASQIRVLLCSDTHGKKEGLDKVLSYVNSSKVHYDFVLHAGDFSNIKFDQHSDPMEESKALNDATETLKAIKDQLKVPIFFIPGNHEANILYDGGVMLEDVVNVHKKSVEVADKLIIIGFGGAPPGILLENNDWRNIWQGYPLSTHEAFDKNVILFFKEEIGKYSADSEFIFLTHCGPWNIETTVDFTGVQSGSKGIKEILDNYNERILLLAHGHLHARPGILRTHDSNCTVLNPGPAFIGRCADILLRKAQDNKWKIYELKLITT